MALDKLVEVHDKQLGRDAKVSSEVERLCKAYHAVFVVRILQN